MFLEIRYIIRGCKLVVHTKTVCVVYRVELFAQLSFSLTYLLLLVFHFI